MSQQVNPIAPAGERSLPRFHPLVWPLWLAAGVLAVGLNPLHNLLLLLGAAIVATVCHDESPIGRAFGLFVRIGLVLIVVRLLVSTVAVGGFAYGQTPLGRLPVVRAPWWLGGLELGGPFTLEMVVGGLVNGIQLLTLLALFGAFNAVADHYGLLRRMPSFLGGFGLAVTIALAFIPQTLAQLAAIREAQQVRGHRFRTWRDTLPLLIPLVSGGLERSLQLAEAMDSRGYGARLELTAEKSLLEQLAVVAGLSLGAIGLFLLFYYPDPRGGIVCLVAAGIVLGLVARGLGSARGRTRYLRERWRRKDIAVVVASVLLLVAAPVARRLAPAALLYTPLPRATLPPFHPLTAGLVLLLVVPALVVGNPARRPAGPRPAPPRR